VLRAASVALRASQIPAICIPHIHGTPFAPPFTGQPCGMVGRRCVRCQHANFQIFVNQGREGLFQAAPTLAMRQLMQTVANLEHVDRGRPDGLGRLLIKPVHDDGLWLGLHQGGQHVGVEDNHLRNVAARASDPFSSGRSLSSPWPLKRAAMREPSRLV
jgi:hypothetical protein